MKYYSIGGRSLDMLCGDVGGFNTLRVAESSTGVPGVSSPGVAESSTGVPGVSPPGVALVSLLGVIGDEDGVCTLGGVGVCTLDGVGVCTLDGVGVCTLDGVGVCILDKAGVWLTGVSMSLGVLGNCSMVIDAVSLSEVAGIVSLVVVNSFIRVYPFNMTGACPIV